MENLSDETLLKYLHRKCSDEEYEIVNNWLNQREENLSALFSLEEAFDSARHEKYTTKSRLNAAKRRLEKEIERDKPIRQFNISASRMMKYAAIAVVIATTGLLLHKWLPSLQTDKRGIIQASDASIKEILLEDGTKVWLNQYTTIRYLENFGPDSREVFLDGEAYFEVSKDPERPFVVHTEALQVKVLGTSFNLRSLKNEETVKTSLIEGVVEVKSNKQGSSVILSPGQKAELNKQTKQLSVKQENTKLDVVWHNDLIPFEKATLEEIAQTLERFYGVTIVLASNIDPCTYSGVIHRHENIDSVLRALQNSIPIAYKIIQSTVFIDNTQS